MTLALTCMSYSKKEASYVGLSCGGNHQIRIGRNAKGLTEACNYGQRDIWHLVFWRDGYPKQRQMSCHVFQILFGWKWPTSTGSFTVITLLFPIRYALVGTYQWMAQSISDLKMRWNG